MTIEKERRWMESMKDEAAWMECGPEFEAERSPVDMFEHHHEQALHDQESAKRFFAKSWPSARSCLSTAIWHSLAAEEQRKRLAIYQHDADAIAMIGGE